MTWNAKIVTLKPIDARELEREVKATHALVRAAERALEKLAKRTGTVFAGRDEPRAARSGSR